MSSTRTRRSFLIVVAGGVASLALSACGGAAATVSTPAASAAASTPAASSASATTSASATSSALAAPATTSTTAPATSAASTAAATASSTASSAVASAAVKPTATPQVLSAGKKAATNITWYINSNDQDPKVIAGKFLPAFQQLHPDISVEATIGPGGIIDAIEKYVALTAGGTAPDLFLVTRAAADLARQGLFTDISPLLAQDKFDTSKYPQAPYNYESTLGGKVYGLPLSMQAEAMALAYNRDLFRKVGVPEPPTKWGDPSWTWETFVDAARKLTVVGANNTTLTQSGIGTLAYDVHLPVLWQGNWVAPRLDQATCDSEAMVQTYTSYFDLAKQYKVMPGFYGLTGPSGTKGFLSGMVGMTTVGGWEFATFRDAKVSWGFAPWPKATRSTYAYNPEEGNIAKTSRYVDATWTFLKWMDNASNYATTFGFMPVIVADAVKWAQDYYSGQPDVRPQVLTDALATAQPTDPIFLLPGADDFVRTTIEPALSKQIPGGADIRTTLQSIKGPLQALVTKCACSGTAPTY